MKRIVAIILCMIMCFSIASCNTTDDVVKDVETTSADTEQTDSTQSEEATDSEEAGSLEQDTQKETEEAKPTKYMLKDNADKLKLHGRMSVVDTGITCDFSASGIEFKAHVIGDVKLKVTATRDTYFTVWIDGQRVDERLYAPNQTSELTVASFTEAGEHTIRILKQTEAAMSLCILNSLTITGEFLEAPEPAQYYIEVIGDSITCGQGNLVGTGDYGQGDALGEDGTQTFCFLAADSLGADVSIIGCSGIGIDKGFTSFSEIDFYPMTSYCRSTTKKYDFSRIPDLVVINLGTNDTTKGSSEDAFKSGVKELIEFVRSKYGTVTIVWTCNMMNDVGVREWLTYSLNELGGEAAGIYLCELNTDHAGGNGHPTIDGHETASLILKKLIREKGLLSAS